jgi:hypothetical protein
LPIYKVKVTSSQLAGFVFLRESELGSGCPLIWPAPTAPKKNEPVDTAFQEGDKECFRKGTFKTVKQLYDRDCETEHDKPAAAKYKIDVNGDGKPDEFLDYADELVLALTTTGGYKALLLGGGMDTEHHDGVGKWLDPVKAGDATYVAVSYHETESFDDSQTEISRYTLYSVKPDGKVYEVLSYSAENADVTLEIRGNPDGTVTLREGDRRSQTLHWNADLARFVP